MPASPDDSRKKSFPHVSRHRLKAYLRGPAGPFLISASVVLSFGIRTWFFDPIAPRPPEGATLACQPLSVTDGDTLEVECGNGRMRVRLWGIDAPEMAQTPLGKTLPEARSDATSRSVISSSRWSTTTGTRGSWRGFTPSDVDVGLALAKEGFAPVPLRYVKDEQYRTAHYAARLAKRGVWKVSGAHPESMAVAQVQPAPG